MQFLQLPLGIVESIAQGDINILVARAIESKAVGMDPSTGYGQINLNRVRSAAGSATAQSRKRHMAVRDRLAITLQSLPQLACTGFQGARMVDVPKRQSRCWLQCLAPR